MFGLLVSKQWFPFNFLTEHGLDYIGDWPTIDQYCVKQPEMKEFTAYYHKTKAEQPVFSMEKILVQYCREDTAVLYQACAKFYQLSYKIEKINPLESISISSLTGKVFRANHLPRTSSIAIIYDNDCAANWRQMQSETAYRY